MRGPSLGIALLTIVLTVDDRVSVTANEGTASRTIVATVLGDPIYADQLESSPGEDPKANLRGRRLERVIVAPLQRRFCVTHDCEPSAEQIRAFVDGMASENDSEPLDGEIAHDFVGTWKFHKALYEKYGGAVIWQVLGPNAVGARRK